MSDRLRQGQTAELEIKPPGCDQSPHRAPSSGPPAVGEEGGRAHAGLTGWRGAGGGQELEREAGMQEGAAWGQEVAGPPPHPSFWSGFSCRPESRRMRQSSYLSREPEVPAAR